MPTLDEYLQLASTTFRITHDATHDGTNPRCVYCGETRRIKEMIKLDKCSKCGARVLPSRMADHWMIAQHYSPNLPATRAVPIYPMSRADVMREFHSRGNVS